LKILSIRHPWAYLIANGDKDIENRMWRTKYRGPFLIHASLALDREGCRATQANGFRAATASYCASEGRYHSSNGRVRLACVKHRRLVRRLGL
jgi:hypothetical protein